MFKKNLQLDDLNYKIENLEEKQKSILAKIVNDYQNSAYWWNVLNETSNLLSSYRSIKKGFKKI